MEKQDTTSHWGCEFCTQSIKLGVPVYDPPTHHCPSSQSRTVREMRHVGGHPVLERQKGKK